jgi:hypothetical protein
MRDYPLHILLKTYVPGGWIFYCECGKLMGKLEPPYKEDALGDLIQGHRLHVQMSLEIQGAWRAGSTTQMTHPIDPNCKPRA